MTTSFDLNSLVWNTIPEKERKAFILLAVPIWFDEELGKKLLTAFSAGPPFLIARVTGYHHIVYRYEEESWHIADGLRAFLLEKAEEFDLELPSVHALLIEHYRAAVQAATRFRKQEYIYLRLYHQVQTDVRAGLRAVFKEYLALEEQERRLRLPSLVRLCETVPIKVNSEPEYRLLKIRTQLLHTPCGKAELEEFRDELKALAYDAEEEILAEEANRFLLAVLDQLPASKPNCKLQKKTEKKLEQNKVDFCMLEEPEQEKEDTGTSGFFAKHVQKIVAQIVHLHRQGLHQEAWEQATGYLVSVQENQKSYLCKSYCKIASSIKDVPDSIEWQLQYFDLAINVNRFDPVALNGKAELLARLGQTDEAFELFDKAHQIQPNDVVALNGKAELLARLGKTDEALELFDKAHQTDSNNVVALNGKAELLARLGKMDDALQLFDKAHQIQPNDVVALTGKAELLARLGKTDNALELFDKAHQTDPNNVVALTGKAELLARLGKTDDALELFDKAHQTDPNNVVALNGKAELLARLGKTDDALELFGKAHQTDPNNVVALTGKANLLAKTEQLAQAIELYQSIPAGIANPYTYCGLGFLLLKRNSSEEDIAAARRLFAEAEKIEPLNVLVLLGLWITHARLGNAKEAENFQRRFEECQEMENKAGNLAVVREQQEDAISSFEEVKQFITAVNLSVLAEYQRIMSIVFVYVQLLMSNQYRSRFCYR